MTRNALPRRPSRIDCPDCGEQLGLVSCGVDDHIATGRYMTRRDRLAGVCNGRVYVHTATGGMECDR